MAAETLVTSKAALTRASRRTLLRHMLRDTNSIVYTNTVLNICLNEALALVQARYPFVAKTIISTTGYRVYALPPDAVRIVNIFLLGDADDLGVDVGRQVGGQVLTGMEVSSSGAGRDVIASVTSGLGQADRVLILDEEIEANTRLLVYYEAARQHWGDPTVIDTGVDTTGKDLNPNDLGDMEAENFFYAAARCAALRFALTYLKTDSSDDYARQYEYAVQERDQYMQATAPQRIMRFTGGLF